MAEEDLAGVAKTYLNEWMAQTANPEALANLQNDVAAEAERYFAEVGVQNGGFRGHEQMFAWVADGSPSHR